MQNERPDGGAQVLDLNCARFEDALAEGQISSALREHASNCARCAGLESEVRQIAGRIREATGPVDIDPAFAAAVYERFEEMSGAVGPGATREHPSVWDRVRPWAYAAAASMALGVAFMWGGHQEQQDLPVTPRLVAESAPLAGPNAPAGAAGALQRAEATPQVRPTEVVELIPGAPASDPEERPQVARAPVQVVPERPIDLVGEIRRALLRQVRGQEGCPVSSKRPVTITVTVGVDGQLSNRQILSSADAKDAHGCVGRALESLLLPPMEEAKPLTMELNW